MNTTKYFLVQILLGEEILYETEYKSLREDDDEQSVEKRYKNAVDVVVQESVN